MRNFQLIAQGVDVLPLLLAVQQRAELWNANTLRTQYPGTPHEQVDDIWLRFDDVEHLLKQNSDAIKLLDLNEVINYPAWQLLPQAKPLIFDLMHRVWGTRLGRAMITRLAPGKRVLPHKDEGGHAAYYERYHVILQNGPGSVFHCGGESVTMAPGSVWWFDNGKEHEIVNNSGDDRLTMIVDIRADK